MRRLVVASAILATLLTAQLSLAASALTPAAASVATPVPPNSDSERAAAALGFLLAAQRPNGSLDNSLGETADFVIGTAAAGYDPATLKDCTLAGTALGYLATASDAAAGDAAKTGKTILAVVAAGRDPAGFSGRDLLTRLAALYHSGTGAYGDGSTFAEAFAILGLEAAGVAVPAPAIAELKALQDPDGSWSYGTAPVAAGQGDTNSTAIALMALNRASDTSANKAALAYLHSQQLPDGGFPYQNSSAWGPPASDPDSDAMVLQALVATGQHPEGTSWRQGGTSVLTHLRASQAASGGFAYPGQAPGAFTTSQVPAALVRIPYAAPTHWTAGRAPARQCIGTAETYTPPPTSTPRPTVRPTARPTVRPTTRPTVRPTASPAPTDTAGPTDSTAPPQVAAATSTSSPAGPLLPTQASGPTELVEGMTFVPADSTLAPASGPSNPSAPSDPSAPPALLYLAAAVLALVAVLGCGWLYINRPWTR